MGYAFNLLPAEHRGCRIKYVMVIDLIGTWIFGVPIGLLAAFVWNLPIEMVYFMLSLEECIRLGIKKS